MKKLLRKVRRKKNDLPPPSSRITNETVAEHRERILAGGRRFKYPLQYVRHKLVINAIIISISALIVAIAIGWWQLYPAQNTSEFMYRVTKVVPVPVAAVDGQPVPYSDYLMRYRSSVYYLEQKEGVSLKNEDGQRQIDYIKQQSMQEAIADAYANKLAKDMGLSITDAELEGFLAEQRKSNNGMSEQAYDAIILDYYDWSPSEYRHATRNDLLRQKVAYKIDKKAQDLVSTISSRLKADSKTDLKALAAELTGENGDNKANYGVSGLVPKDNRDGGRAAAASRLQKGQVSSVVKSSDGEGYYFVRLLDSNDKQVNYEYIQVPLTTFVDSLANLVKNEKVKEYISIPKVAGGNQ